MTQARGRFTMEFDHYEQVPSHIIQDLVDQYKQSRDQNGH
jgi:translation elongation factor EF-G